MVARFFRRTILVRLGARGLALTMVWLCACPALGIPDRLLEWVPGDALAAALFDRAPSAESTTQPSTVGRMAAAALLRHVRDMGLLRDVDTTVALVVDILTLVPELAPYAWAVVLLDVQVNPLSGGGFRLSGLSAGLVVLTDGDHVGLERQIQALLNLHGNVATGHLTQRETQGGIVHALQDQRLPDWSILEWGAVADAYLVTVGRGTFDRIAAILRDKGPNFAADEWLPNAHRRCRGPGARWEGYIAFQTLRSRLAAIMGGQPQEVLAALGLGEVTRGLWTVGLVGRTVDAACVLETGGRDEYVPITLTGESARPFDVLIPPTEPNGTVLDARPREMIPRICRAYLAARSPSVRERWITGWATFQAEVGIVAQRDLLDHLGSHMVLHNFPQHPLHLPIFATVLVEIESSPEAVRMAFERLLKRAQHNLAEAMPEGGWPRVERGEDGIWYILYGLYGPALVVTDRWIVLSYSPHAVRENAQYLNGLNRPPTTSTTSTASPP